MRIGEFGAAQHEQRQAAGEKDDFVFYGETFTVEQPMPAVLALQLGAAITGKIDETEGFAAIWEALRISLTVPGYRWLVTPPEDGAVVDEDGLTVVDDDESQFRRFYRLAVERGAGLDALMRLAMMLFEAQTGRPTRQASASSAGRPSISQSSRNSSIPAAPSHLRSVDDLIRGDPEGTVEVEPSSVVLMGDGTVAQVESYGERTG